MVGASHTYREGDILADRGYQVTLCGEPGWRAHSYSAGAMKENLAKALEDMSSRDVIVVQCLDNTSYMARTEEGGDLPIRQFFNGEYHVEGELILACKERQHVLFKSILPFLRLLEGRKVIFVVPIIRYVINSCCSDLEHVVNSEEPGFEEGMRAKLAECRKNFGDFLFCSGLRGFRVLDPNPVLPNNILDEDDPCWGTDPVHPEMAGYERIVDLFEKEIEKLLAGTGGKKRPAADEAGNLRKKPRAVDNRAGWISGSSGVAVRLDVQQGGSGGPFRGRPYRGRPFRGRWFRGGRFNH